MNTQNPHTIADNCGHHRRSVSWSAIFIGALYGIGISFLFNLFAVGIGLSAFTTTTPQTLAVGGIIGLIIISIVSMGTLGWIAGFIGATRSLCFHDKMQCNYGCIYGFTAWCLALVLGMLLAMPASQFVKQSVHALNPTIQVHRMYTQSKDYPEKNDVNQTSQATSLTANANGAIATNATTDADARKILITTTFITFVMFFIGAISASIGGHMGYAFYSNKEDIP